VTKIRGKGNNYLGGHNKTHMRQGQGSNPNEISSLPAGKICLSRRTSGGKVLEQYPGPKGKGANDIKYCHWL
jgi:hypothetical protein